MPSPSTHRLEVPESLRSFVANALNRLAYLRPNWVLRAEASTIVAEISDAKSEEVVREIRYALYREKILAETLDMRRDLLRMVSRS